MPLPLLVPAIAGAGWVAGKVAKLTGDGFLSSANSTARRTQESAEMYKKQYEDNRRKILQRMSTYLVLVSNLTGKLPNIQESDLQEMPSDMKRSWERILASHGYTASFNYPVEFAKSDKQAAIMVRGAFGLQKNGHPGMAATAMAAAAVTVVKDGIAHSIDCKNYKAKVEAWAIETIASARKQVEAIAKDLEGIERDWDELITPELKGALGPPRDEKLLVYIYAWAQKLDSKAKELVSHENESSS